MSHAFAGIELGLGFGNGRGFLRGIDLLENGFRLGHVMLCLDVPIIVEFGCYSESFNQSVVRFVPATTGIAQQVPDFAAFFKCRNNT